jgi:hypothetical protein
MNKSLLKRSAVSRLPHVLVATAIVLAVTAPRIAHAAEEAPVRCGDIAVPRGQIKAVDGTWFVLTDIQRAFVAGVFVLNPNTAPGLPFGDGAALARVKGDKGGLIFFLDGDVACDPMPIPDELIEMLEEIGEGDIFHEGQTD